MIKIHLEGDGCWPDLADKMHKVIRPTNFEMASLHDGTVGKNPSVSFRLDLPDGRTVFHEVTYKEFMTAMEVFKAKYGEVM